MFCFKMKCVSMFVLIVALSCEGQRPPGLPLTPTSFEHIVRGFTHVPGRPPTPEYIIIRHYSTNLTSPQSYFINDAKALLSDPDFDVNRPTVLYAHGYVGLVTDESVQTVMAAYIQRADHNTLLLDWSNIALGKYLQIAKALPAAAAAVGEVFLNLLKQGLPVEKLHLVGHSMGSHFVANVARYLDSKGMQVPRLTGLDPAYPGFYPPVAAPPISPTDARFVDVIHTDGGGFGTPTATGHVDFWPNGGQAKQPGCLSATVPLSVENFCSHWRAWAVWAESLNSDSFLARKCEDYDTFLRGQCQEQPTVYMGFKATPDLRGNYYLRTAATSPYGLQLKGAE